MILMDIVDREPPVDIYKTAQGAKDVSAEDNLQIITGGEEINDETK